MTCPRKNGSSYFYSGYAMLWQLPLQTRAKRKEMDTVKISDLTPLERRLLFMIRLSDALCDPAYQKQTIKLVAEYGEDGSLQNSDIQKGGDNR